MLCWHQLQNEHIFFIKQHFLIIHYVTWWTVFVLLICKSSHSVFYLFLHYLHSVPAFLETWLNSYGVCSASSPSSSCFSPGMSFYSVRISFITSQRVPSDTLTTPAHPTASQRWWPSREATKSSSAPTAGSSVGRRYVCWKQSTEFWEFLHKHFEIGAHFNALTFQLVPLRKMVLIPHRAFSIKISYSYIIYLFI